MPSGLVSASGNRDIDGILWGNRWTNASLTYTFPDAAGDYAYKVQGLEAFNSAQMAAAHRIMAMYNQVIAVPITYTAAASANIRFAEVTSIDIPGLGPTDVKTALGLAPDPSAFSPAGWGDTFYNHSDFNAPRPGNYAWITIMHEAGHALGLKHGHMAQTNGGSGITFPALPAAHNSIEFSIMTYATYIGARTSGPSLADPESGYAQSLMQLDIQALQYLYGADYGTNAGNTVYRFSPTNGTMFVNGASQGTPLENKIFRTIWDGNGSDTYDLGSYTTSVSINLNPGAFSRTSAAQLADLGALSREGPGHHMARGNVANALLFEGDLRALIENARGGSANDVIVGNVAGNALNGLAGNDTLNGGVGNDRLTGGLGRDVMTGAAGDDDFDFNTVAEVGRGSGRDLVRDFTHLVDDLDLSTIDANGAAAGNGAFTFLAPMGARFTGAKGQLHWNQSNAAGTAHDKTIVEGDVNGDRVADFQIELFGLKALTSADFIL